MKKQTAIVTLGKWKRLARGVLMMALCLWVATSNQSYAQCPPTFNRTIILTPSDVYRMTGRATFRNPTTMALAPDGRLFVAQMDGMIHVLTLDANRRVTDVKLLDLINARDREKGRLITGMTFGPGGSRDLYVSHSEGLLDDPTISIYSGIVTKIIAPEYIYQTDIASVLPRSRHDHAPNGLAFGPDNMLYLAIGGTTNFGAPSSTMFNVAEMPRSAAILKINPITQAISTYATGFRNSYDLVWHSNGYLYATDNAGNEGWGLTPGPAEGCPGQTPRDMGTPPDKLNRIPFVAGDTGLYYGHPNPSRGECIYEGGPNYVPPLWLPPRDFAISMNGITEWKGPASLGACRGNLIAASWGTGHILRIVLKPDGTVDQAASGPMLDGFSGPLDVIVDPSDGTIFLAEFSQPDPDPDVPPVGAVTILVPQTPSSANAKK